MRDRFAITAATAMIGTACFGPYCQTRTGISMIDEPVPTMPLMVPAIRPTMSTKTKLKETPCKDASWPDLTRLDPAIHLIRRLLLKMDGCAGQARARRGVRCRVMRNFLITFQTAKRLRSRGAKRPRFAGPSRDLREGGGAAGGARGVRYAPLRGGNNVPTSRG